MEEVLKSLDAEYLVDTFRDNEVGPKEVLLLKDSEFENLGVQSIGLRAKLRDRCRLRMEEDSPVVQRIELFQSRRRGRSCQASRASNKPTRKLKVGWKRLDNNGSSRLITHQKGGGSHTMEVTKQSTLQQLTATIRDLFFPNGHSRLQKLDLSEVNYSLTTFTGDPIPDVLENGDPFTLGGYFQQIHRHPVRIYLQTVDKDNPDDIAEVTEDSQENPVQPITNSRDRAGDTSHDVQVPLETQQEPEELPTLTRPRNRLTLRRPATTRPVQVTTSTPKPDDEPVIMLDDNPTGNLPSNQTPDDGSSQRLTSARDDESFFEAGTPTVAFRVNRDFDEDHLSENIPYDGNIQQELRQGFLSLMMSLQDETTIQVSRDRLIDDVFRLYGDSELCQRALRVEFVGEMGDDLGGLTKDFFTNAWKSLLEMYFQGEDAVVPFLPLHRMRHEKDRYVSIGRFLSHMAASIQILPPRLSRCSLLSIVFGGDSASDETLLNDFVLHLSPTDRRLVQRALDHFEVLSQKQKDDLVDFYSIHQLHQIPSAQKIKEQILSIAQEVIHDKPAPFISKIRQGIPGNHLDTFWSLLTTQGINLIFLTQRPTGLKVLNVIKTDEVLRPDEERSLYFLKQYICGLDQDELSDFLLFVTGSSLMPDELKVSFRNVVGPTRCPIAHTCSNLIELPSTYTSLQDLKREFRCILASSHTFEMSIL